MTTATKTKLDLREFSWLSRWTFQVANVILEPADVQIGGERDFDIQILRKRTARRFLNFVFGMDRCFLAEAYMAGYWNYF